MKRKPPRLPGVAEAEKLLEGLPPALARAVRLGGLFQLCQRAYNEHRRRRERLEKEALRVLDELREARELEAKYLDLLLKTAPSVAAADADAARARAAAELAGLPISKRYRDDT